MTLLTLTRANYTRRWHANPEMADTGETVGHHQAMVAQIILRYHAAPSTALLYEALHHDLGEVDLGDVTGPAKRENPALAALLDKAEEANRLRVTDRTPAHLTAVETAWLKFADRLAATLHVYHTRRWVLMGDGWPEDIARLAATWESLPDFAPGQGMEMLATLGALQLAAPMA